MTKNENYIYNIRFSLILILNILIIFNIKYPSNDYEITKEENKS